MRLPVEPLPPLEPGVTENIYDIRQAAALAAAKRVQERTLPPLVTYARVPAVGEGEAGGASGVASELERRSGRERRAFCRRVEEQPVLLDTRLDSNRRKGPRRAGDTAANIDEEV